jgi:hypothetical protein
VTTDILGRLQPGLFPSAKVKVLGTLPPAASMDQRTMWEFRMVRTDSGTQRTRLSVAVLAIVLGAATAGSAGASAGSPAVSVARSPGAPGDELWHAAYGTSARAAAMALSPDGSRVYVTGTSLFNTATVAYDAATGARLWNKAGSGGEPSAIAVSADGATVFVVARVAGSPNKVLTIESNAATGKARWSATWSDPTYEFTGVPELAVSVDGRFAMVISRWVNQHQASMDIVAYRTKNGRVAWSRVDAPAAEPFPAPSAAAATSTGALIVTGTLSNRNPHGIDTLTIAYDVESGSELWRRTFQGSRDHANFGYDVTSSDDGGVSYVTGSSSGKGGAVMTTLAYDVTTGDLLWSAIDGPSTSSGWGVVTAGDPSVAAIGDVLDASFHSQARTIVYDAASGDVRWMAVYPPSGGGATFPDDVAARADGSVVYSLIGTCPTLSCDAGGRAWVVAAYAAATGTLLWTATHPAPGRDLRAAALSATATEVFVAGDRSDSNGHDTFLTVAFSAV